LCECRPGFGRCVLRWPSFNLLPHVILDVRVFHHYPLFGSDSKVMLLDTSTEQSFATMLLLDRFG
jgi:hypothetical protein